MSTEMNAVSKPNYLTRLAKLVHGATGWRMVQHCGGGKAVGIDWIDSDGNAHETSEVIEAVGVSEIIKAMLADTIEVLHTVGFDYKPSLPID